ncbi:response regulator transcription factor [Ectobacillus ponti]|uniref:Heme response regulator HssR n=1 Tax=Ectobacillus ponti TaxID=2961894 RepID=A0AA42BQM1_9BACI|nr:response regulator transcription factor [Ectobacillus ponti]MCP8970435.1 response regulator transcription factor [Ectobacillus ponti]
MISILVADDDPYIRGLVRHHLQLGGYQVQEAADGEAAMNLLEAQPVHMAIVDIVMPHKDGYEVCRDIRRQYDIPILLLTAKEALADKEKGFAAGTDDYLVKPFEPRELLFRVKALLRRYQTASSDVITLGQTVIDRKSYEVRCQGQVLFLPLKEFELLFQLASYPGRSFSRGQLIELVWGLDFEGDERTVDVHIKRLRDRFAKRTDDFSISTVRGVGYKLETKG